MKIIHKFILLLLFIFSGTDGFSQTDSIVEKVFINKTNSKYISHVVVNDKLFAINDNGKVIIWDLNKLDTIHFALNDTSVFFDDIFKDQENQLFLTTRNRKGHIYKLNPEKLTYRLVHTNKETSINTICFNSKNEMYIIGSNIINNKILYYDENNHIYIIKKRVWKYFWKIIYTDKESLGDTYLDSKDRLWMFKWYGKNSERIRLFDTKSNKLLENMFFSTCPILFFPISIFEDKDSNIYITSGDHGPKCTGEIIKITPDNMASLVFNSRNMNLVDTTEHEVNEEGVVNVIYTKDNGVNMGPGAFNSGDSCIYFATFYGFYKANLTQEGTFLVPTPIYSRPKPNWARKPPILGSFMYCESFEFIRGNILLFRTYHDGIGLYDGKKLVMLR